MDKQVMRHMFGAYYRTRMLDRCCEYVFGGITKINGRVVEDTRQRFIRVSYLLGIYRRG